MLRWLIPLLICALPLRAEEVVLGLSHSEVSITADFDGSELLIFGAVKREAPIKDPPLEVIVTVAGPSTPLTVFRKDRVAGIWINNSGVTMDRAPSFYALASSAPLSDILSRSENLRHDITINRAIRAVGISGRAGSVGEFRDALVRMRTGEGLYQVLDSQVTFREQTLFRTAITMPANLTEGTYTTRIFLIRGQEVVNWTSTPIEVRKVGLERFLFSLSRNQPLLYGLLSLAIAIVAGWGASGLFRMLRNG
ncbi:MAG: TIGR02186 family protein [Paracoccaceae bacterium]